MRCDQCQMLSINGVLCHETGCSNSRKTWIEERGEWVKFVECRECSADVEVGTVCDCQTLDADLGIETETFERKSIRIRRGKKMSTAPRKRGQL
jgi:hypothetical protein